jgi:UrcA family protein
MKSTVVAVVLAALSSLACAGVDEGIAAYARGDYAAALSELHPAAEQGDARAQAQLGVMYEKAQGVSKNEVAAFNWYRRAADQGEASAQYHLGRMYEGTRRIPQDDAQAVEWLLRAAEQDFAPAQVALGRHYELGKGIVRDRAEAAKWYSEAAAQLEVVVTGRRVRQPYPTPSEGTVVRFADLDLTRNEGVAALYRRLKDAAETACAPQNGRELGSQMRYRLCWQSALTGAVAQVGQPALSAYCRVRLNGRHTTFPIAQN